MTVEQFVSDLDELVDAVCARVGKTTVAMRPLLGLRLAGHPMHFAMQRRQLLNLKRRVEAVAA